MTVEGHHGCAELVELWSRLGDFGDGAAVPCWLYSLVAPIEHSRAIARDDCLQLVNVRAHRLLLCLPLFRNVPRSSVAMLWNRVRALNGLRPLRPHVARASEPASS